MSSRQNLVDCPYQQNLNLLMFWLELERQSIWADLVSVGVGLISGIQSLEMLVISEKTKMWSNMIVVDVDVMNRDIEQLVYLALREGFQVM